MKNHLCIVAAMVSLALLSGCSTVKVKSSTARFHTLPPEGSGQTFLFDPTQSQRGSLEYEAYAELIEEKLIQYGWVPGTDPEDADYLVVFLYSIDGGETVSGSRPIYGQIGGGISVTSGSVRGPGGRSSFTGTTYTPSTFGQVGSAPYTKEVYGRSFDLSILDNQRSTPEETVIVYEGRVTSRGSAGQLAAVIPTMIEALFLDFPGVSGDAGEVALPSKNEPDQS
ncbi:MAG: DUF4136 domain-containing protein [Verrucomicrobiota bacterium]